MERSAVYQIGTTPSWVRSPNHQALKDAGEEVGRLLSADEVDVALLVPCDPFVRAPWALWQITLSVLGSLRRPSV